MNAIAPSTICTFVCGESVTHAVLQLTGRQTGFLSEPTWQYLRNKKKKTPRLTTSCGQNEPPGAHRSFAEQHFSRGNGAGCESRACTGPRVRQGGIRSHDRLAISRRSSVSLARARTARNKGRPHGRTVATRMQATVENGAVYAFRGRGAAPRTRKSRPPLCYRIALTSHAVTSRAVASTRPCKENIPESRPASNYKQPDICFPHFFKN